MATVLLVAGTHGRHDAWWRAGSPFVLALEARGHHLAAPDEPFSWATGLDGLIGENDEWEAAGEYLRLWLDKHPVDIVIAHSHGGLVCLYAAAAGATIPRLITVATPVRADLRQTREYASAHIAGFWAHIYGGLDGWQLLGELGDGGGPFAWARRMPEAHLNVWGGWARHGALLDPARWTALGWWGWLG